ncbi:MAG: RNA polymerase sigma factor [Planctomycetota bacterium]|jgi:RNA polymerase sigma-70 factor (ECF subfamily)
MNTGQSSDSDSWGRTSTSLLQRVRERDEQAWENLVYIYGPLVETWCRKWTLRSEDVADVFQEVFAAVDQRIHAFRKERPSDSFRGWLWTITRNKVTDHIRRVTRLPQATGGTDAHMRIQQVPLEEPLDDAESTVISPAHRGLDLIRSSFTDQTWQAFEAVAVHGRTPKDVAADLGMEPMAVYKAKSRVMQRLREELAELVDQ